MAQLLESGQAADVRFKVEEEELAAHKFILTARSPVFRSVYQLNIFNTGRLTSLCICVYATYVCHAFSCPASIDSLVTRSY